MLTNEERNRSEAELGAAKSRAAGGHGAERKGEGEKRGWEKGFCKDKREEGDK